GPRSATVEAATGRVNERYAPVVDGVVDILGTSGSVAVDVPGMDLCVFQPLVHKLAGALLAGLSTSCG
ncbi:MAG: hypothetical protein M3313_02275, partial [Actinomycetota bacterium]|nr:hypothetical protein [Actinomycetota bacterium]